MKSEDADIIVVDGSEMVSKMIVLLKALQPLAADLATAVKECPDDKIACLALVPKAMQGFQKIFQAAFAVQEALKVATDTSESSKSDEEDKYNLADMEVSGRS